MKIRLWLMHLACAGVSAVVMKGDNNRVSPNMQGWRGQDRLR